jgi:hypothetical protein
VEGEQHAARDAQFGTSFARPRRFTAEQPVTSEDTKKKAFAGDFANKGQEWQRKGEPPKVLFHDFPDGAVGEAIPYGVYDVGRNEGWVSVGVSDITALAVATIRSWVASWASVHTRDAHELYVVPTRAAATATAHGLEGRVAELRR